MEYKTEIINISKIKEGFFIGDRIAGTSLDVVLQFKISHMINAAGSQILNQFETIGVRYLTLNWTENASQKLIDSKDEIQNRIVSFIDDAIENGEGLLAYSVKGQNRACIIIIIYFMRKYFWSLNKCLEFLRVKKKNASIPPYFLKQLAEYEGRIKKKLSNDWYNLNNVKDKEEYLIRNTYLNSLINENNKRRNNMKTNSITNYDCNFKYNSKPHVSWGDNNIYHKFNKLIINNEQKDLILQKNVKNVVSHMRLRPKKKCIKEYNGRNDNKDFNIYNYYSNSMNNNNNYKTVNNSNYFGNNNNEMNNLINLGLNMKIVDKINQISNNFNNLSLPKQKSNSAGKKFMKNQNNLNNNANYNSKPSNDESNMSNVAKLNNFFENSDELKNIYNKLSYKKQKRYNNFKHHDHIPKNKIEQYNSNNSSSSIFDYQRKRTSTYDKQNNNVMNNSTNIKQYINMPNNLNNNSINMINYSFFNNAQNFNNSFSKKNNETYFEKKMSKTQQNFNKTKNHNKVVQNNPQNRMNNSASNFYNYYNGNKMNEYYNLMGKSFNSNNYNKYNGEQNMYQMKRNINDDINFILNDTDIYANKINHHLRKNSFNHKKEKRNSTPNNLLPKNNQNYYSNSNNSQMYINYLNHSKIDSDKKNELSKNSSYINNKSFILNPKNQCKKLYIYIYIIFKYYSFGVFRHS